MRPQHVIIANFQPEFLELCKLHLVYGARGGCAAQDMERQQLNVFRMRLLGAEVLIATLAPVTNASHTISYPVQHPVA